MFQTFVGFFFGAEAILIFSVSFPLYMYCLSEIVSTILFCRSSTLNSGRKNLFNMLIFAPPPNFYLQPSLFQGRLQRELICSSKENLHQSPKTFDSLACGQFQCLLLVCYLVESLDQKHQYHLVTCQTCIISGSLANPQNMNLYFNKTAGDSCVH